MKTVLNEAGFYLSVIITSEALLTDERRLVSGDGQQVVHDEQEDRVAQDEGHLEGRAIDTVGRQQEAEDVHRDEEAAGDQQVHHVEDGSASQNQLRKRERERERDA